MTLDEKKQPLIISYANFENSYRLVKWNLDL
ncbi:hypothetical protein BCL90_4128 [Pedobacter alluvionis]|uniref:Uncharacterized protein n=1 Tax=Pedobacter alluvionis TaxID=475253 RepID=A0A497XV04_9SPHI|nr:hypothetical protein BCL90_4128 [Pedobacter alluvionis]